jgi:predicted dehydrogenase
VRFKSGAMGVIEASFTSPLLSVFEMTLYGTKGSYYARFGGADVAEIRLPGEANKRLDIAALPATLKSPVLTWIDACVNGASDADYGIDAAIELVKYMIAAYESDRQNGKRVLL